MNEKYNNVWIWSPGHSAAMQLLLINHKTKTTIYHIEVIQNKITQVANAFNRINHMEKVLVKKFELCCNSIK